MRAQDTRRVPIVRVIWLVREIAFINLCRSGVIWTFDASERVHAAEAALRVNPVGPTSQFAHLAFVVPIVRRVRLIGKMATTRRALHIDEIARATETALCIHAISLATELPILAKGVPEVTHPDRIVLECALCANRP